MNILFIGDIIGKKGRLALNNILSSIKNTYEINLCIANGENAAGGFGLTSEIADQLFNEGIDILTSGNHIWDKKDIFQTLNKKDSRILRPANYPEEAIGKGSIIIETDLEVKVGVVNISGRVFIDYIDCPFKAIDNEIKKISAFTKIIIVDMHAEATSEKVAFAWYVDGRVSAVLGTHTHVQTADEKILPNKTAYITDVGMTGPIHSVIGAKKEIAIQRFTSKMPIKYEVAKGEVQFNAVVLKINENTGHAEDITRLNMNLTTKNQNLR